MSTINRQYDYAYYFDRDHVLKTYVDDSLKVWFDTHDLYSYLDKLLNQDSRQILLSNYLKYIKTFPDLPHPLISETGISLFINKHIHLQSIQYARIRFQTMITFSHLKASNLPDNLQDLLEKDLERIFNISKEYTEDLELLSDKLSAQSQEISDLKAKLSTPSQSSPLLTSTSIAKDYGLSAKSLHDLLIKLRIIYRSKNSGWELKQSYSHFGYSRKHYSSLPNGTTKISNMWTPAGHKFISSILESNGFIIGKDNQPILESLLKKH